VISANKKCFLIKNKKIEIDNAIFTNLKAFNAAIFLFEKNLITKY